MLLVLYTNKTNKTTITITVITVCKNAEDTIEETIKSVLNQTYENIEYIIIDGKSTDKTLFLINKYKRKISYIKSEKDNGIYHAMNKGIKAANGSILFFLNANDTLYNKHVVKKVIDTFLNTDVDIVYGDVLMKSYKSRKPLYRNYQKFTKSFLYYDHLPHQSTAYKKTLFIKYGDYKNTYKILADYDWSLRVILKSNVKLLYIATPISICSIGGISTDQQHIELSRKEANLIRKKYFTLYERIFYRVNINNIIRKLRWFRYLRHESIYHEKSF